MYGYGWEFWFGGTKYCDDQFEESLLDLGWSDYRFDLNQYSMYKWRS